MARRVSSTPDSLWGFREGDIITSLNPASKGYNKRLVVVSINHDEEEEQYYLSVRYESGGFSGRAASASNLILLERPGCKLKVGDEVVISASSFADKTAKRGKVIVLDPNQAGKENSFLVDMEERVPGRTDGEPFWNQPWFPEIYKIEGANYYWALGTSMTVVGADAPEQPSCEVPQAEVPFIPETQFREMAGVEGAETPEWLNDLLIRNSAGIGHCFAVWGNVYDIHRNRQGQYMSLLQYLYQTFEQRELVMTYSISAGLQFAKAEMETVFRQKYMGEAAPDPQAGSATARAAQSLRQDRMKTPLAQLIGKSPKEIFPRIEQILSSSREADGKPAKRKVFIIDYAQNVVPNAGAGANVQTEDRINVETIERWARDIRIKEAGNIIILRTPSFAGLADCLRSSQSGVVAIRVPKPNDEERTARWQNQMSFGSVEIGKGLDAEVLGRLTNGLSLTQIDNIYNMAKAEGKNIDMSLVKEKKQEILETEFGDRIKIKVPEWGFDYFGGKDNVKKYLLEIRDNVLNGINRRAPMGILASGPPGTGKTFLFECWAYECGFNFVEIVNPKSMWVGQSQEIMEKILAALDDLAPVIVVEDEADQSEPSRDTPNGDSGVSNNLRQAKFKFCSDPKRRGRVIWVRISNRDDLIDAAYKRKGRTDDNIPFLLPDEEDCKKIFQVMFARYKIPTDIKDLSSYAKLVKQKIFCTGADIEWMVLEADKASARQGLDKVGDKDLLQAVEDWEMDLDPSEVDRQTVLAIKGSSKSLRPADWKNILSSAESRLKNGYRSSEQSSVNPEFVKGKA